MMNTVTDAPITSAEGRFEGASSADTAGVVADADATATDASDLEAEPTLGSAGSLTDRRVVVAMAALVAAVRYLFAGNRELFSMGPDEMATVGMARFLGGGTWSMLA